MKTIVKVIKRMTIIITLCFLNVSFVFAGLNGTDKKIIELQKIITLSAQQEEEIRSLHSIYTQIVDSALLYVSDPIESAQIKFSMNR